MEAGPPRFNPNDAAAQPKVIPPPTMAGSGNIAAQEAGVQGPFPPPSSSPSLMNLLGYVLRGAPIFLTFLAGVLMGSAKSSEGIIKSTETSPLVYFTVVNILVCVYSIASLAMSFVSKAGSASPFELIISAADLLVITFLLTSNGAASAASVYYDDTLSCLVYPGYCAQVKSAIVFSMFASVAYLAMILLRSINLRK